MPSDETPVTIRDLDIDALRARYRHERDKQMGTSGREVPELTGTLTRYLDDPHIEVIDRPRVQVEVDAIIVGAGLGGLMLGAAMRDAGLERVMLIDAAGDVGGVWYWNRYPGAMCDVESLIYMPLLEELGYTPTSRYAPASEIFAHAQAIAKHYDLYADGLFHTKVEGMRWNESVDRWVIRTDRGDEISSQLVILANGPLSRPKLPDIPGIESFRGASFHTSRWDYSYTGGSPDAPELANLQDKRVAIIGTGATGLQCVPHLGRWAGELFVCQRTPSTVAVRDNRPLPREWVLNQEPGWQAKRRRNFTTLLEGGHVEEDLVNDSWTDLYRNTLLDPAYKTMSKSEAAQAKERADFARMEQVRLRIESVVADPATAERLKPYYAYFCKRAGFHDEYLPTFNRPNVTLIDTDGRGLDRVYDHGVVVAGRPYELNCLIFATGFEFDTPYTHRIGFDVVGQGGISLADKWAHGISTLHGLTTSGFPNLFIMPGVNSQSVATTNLVDVMQENASHVGYIVAELRQRGVYRFEVDEQAEAEWVATIVAHALDRRAFLEACTPGRGNNEGRPDERPPQNANYGKGAVQFFSVLESWRRDGGLRGLRLYG